MVCNLKSIAEELNVTVNTVSRALNNKDGISETMKEKVRQKAAELGYVPNLSASNLRTGKTNTIAIVYDHFFNPYYNIVTGLIHNNLSKNNYNTLIFTDRNENSILREETVRGILARGVDAILSFLEVESGALELIRKAGKYLLVLGRDCSDLGIDCISTDDLNGGYMATKYLIDNGHKDILFFSASKKISCSRLRIQGYRTAMAEAGIPIKEENILYLKSDGFNGKELTLEAEKRKLSYTAIFCFSDILAYEAMNTLIDLGKPVPEEVSVIGYDYIESNFLLPVKLSTIDTDKAQAADIAAEIILYKLKNKNAKKFFKMHSPRLVEGKTVKKIN